MSAATNKPHPTFQLTVNRRRFVSGSMACAAVASSAILGSSPAWSQRAAKTEADDVSGPPTVIFRGGTVYTVNPDRKIAEAVAVRGKRILAVGTNSEIDKLAGSTTKIVELEGRMVLPGFVEGHTHPLLGSFFASGLNLQLPTLDDALKLIAGYAKDNPTGLLRGFGWRVDMFPPEGPNRADLDRILPDRPAFFFAIDGHSLWANTKALEMAGINRDTPDPIPDFSYFVRDANGDATGYILEVPAVLATVNAIEPISISAMGRYLEGWLPLAAAAGITSVYDAGVPPIGDDEGALIELYTALEQQGRLPFRVVASSMMKGPPVDKAAQNAVALRKRIDTELVQARVMKIVADGTAEGYTALLLEPYADRPDTIGQSPFSQEQLTQMVMDAEAVGIDVHIHACGEGTTRMALNAIEAAIAAKPDYNRRHTIAHLVLVDDADMPRFAKIGLTSQYSGNWMCADPSSVETLIERIGVERQSKIYRVRSTLESGARVSFGTDWPGAGYFATYKPLDAIQIAVTRQSIGKPDAPVLGPAAEKLDVEQAIHANTMGAAYQLRLENQVGSIEAGKLADLIVLEKNILSVDVHSIASVHVDMTMMNGRFTHGGAA
ncbi:amidohydrolase [Microvirga alba]|uniref:amidohydrolase n=1 Tax=Microvirga alba TaxID=2791025 RepID=UPI002D21AE78|nr:amidohydrolase [Microvirga alba]